MKEAVVTVIVPATDSEPAHTEVWRIEFEGEFGDFLEMVENFATMTRIVAAERLVSPKAAAEAHVRRQTH
jgi:hypothetical protein